jgi:CDP-glucose 4,6-dehydratase
MTDKFWKDRNVFVTGCTGLLGSWLTKALVERGANVVGLIRDLVPKSNLNWSGFNDKITIVRGEMEDYFLLERAINEYEIDTVFHLAAQTIVTIANRNPISTFETNIGGTWNVLEACRRSPLVRRIVVASSDKAYGDQEKLPYDENTPLEGRHPYDVSKSCADLVCRAYFETYKLPVCVTRCGNFYGGGDLNFNRIVPGTVRSVLNNERPLIRSDGTLVRDYFYIEDAVEAYLLLAEKMENKEIHGEAFNFSNELQITALEMVEKIIAVMDSNLKPEILNEATNEIKHQYLSAQKAKSMLNWHPRYTLEEGLKKTIEWYKLFFL